MGFVSTTVSAFKKGLASLRRTFLGPSAEEMVRDFIRRFPDRCMICSMWYYGVTHGHETRTQPEPHLCIEEEMRGKLSRVKPTIYSLD